jgi:hypothetical protein
VRQFAKHRPDYDYFLSLSRPEKLHRLNVIGCGLPIVLRSLFYSPAFTPSPAPETGLADETKTAAAATKLKQLSSFNN